MELTSEDVRDILRVLDGLPYQELQLETTRFRLSLRRSVSGDGGSIGEGEASGGGGWTQSMEVLTAPVELSSTVLLGAVSRGNEPPSASREPVDGTGLTDVRAPLLGTFYRAPRPGAAPFVEVGSTVAPDTVVCIIETMKLMNSVTAGVSGTIAQILIENAEFAEQDTVLMRIRQD